jgi:hypothetical protein
MSLAVFLPLLFWLAVCLLPVWLLRHHRGAGARDYFVSPAYTPPQAIRNSSIAYSLRLAVFGPVFLLGATGDFWPVVIGATCFGLGIYLVYLLRRRIFAFLENALDGDRSITVHAFIARQHGDDPRLRLFAASLTLFVLVAAVACEAFVLLGFFKLVFGNDTLARALAFGTLLLAVVYAVPAGHPGVIYSGQLQLGAIFFGLFGAAALLLYLHVSALMPLPPHGAFAIGFAAVYCLAILIYRRSRYIETGSVAPASRSANLLSRFGKLLNPVISIFVVLLIVLAGMEFSATSSSAPADAGTTLSTGSGVPFIGLAALVLLPLFYPLADIVHWQRLAAIEKNREAYQGDTARWLKALRQMFRIYAVEIPLLWLFIASLGAMTVAALALANGTEVTQALVQEVASGENPIAAAAFSLLLIVILAIAVSTMASCFSAGLCTIRYDMPSESLERFSSGVAGRLFFLAIIVALILVTETLPMSFASSSFLAVVFALCSPLLSFAPLILGPIVLRHVVSPSLALCIMGLGAGSTAGGLAGYLATGNETWLWAAVPVCLGLGFLLLTVSRLSDRQGSRMR